MTRENQELYLAFARSLEREIELSKIKQEAAMIANRINVLESQKKTGQTVPSV